MRKLALGIAIVWLLIVALIVAATFPAMARAAEIPSAASGAYAAPDRLCRVVLSRAGANHIDVDLLCVTDAGLPTSTLVRVEAWAGRCVGSQYTANVFALSGSSPLAGFVALDAFTGAGLQVRRAPDPATLYNGGGAAETWTLVRALQSPAPYTCGKRPGSGQFGY